MAIILPFHGIRYSETKAGDINELVAPPYDVVDQDMRDELVHLNPHNIFSLELPKGGMSEGSKADKYATARNTFRSWLESGILERENEAAIYPYDVTFSVRNARFTRKGFIALIRIEAWEEHLVRPHEQTFNKVTEDRLRLFRATEAQFSQIFALYRHNEEVRSILERSEQLELYSVRDADGNTHMIRKLADRGVIGALHDAMKDSVLYIADGHHRYTTALNYRNEMRKKYGDSPEKPYNYMMTYLVDAEDPGLVVLPTHRTVSMSSGYVPSDIRKKAEAFFERETLPLKRPPAPALAEALDRALCLQPERQGLGVFFGHDNSAEIWWLKETAKQDLLLDYLPSALCNLDVVMFEEAVLKQTLRFDVDTIESGNRIRYSASAEEALTEIGENEIFFFLRPTPVDQVLAIADAGLTMPHKATFFYPKILTGLVMNSTHRDEKVTLF